MIIIINLIWSCIIGGIFVAIVPLSYFGQKVLVMKDKTHKTPIVKNKFIKTVQMQYYLVPIVFTLFFVICHFIFKH